MSMHAAIVMKMEGDTVTIFTYELTDEDAGEVMASLGVPNFQMDLPADMPSALVLMNLATMKATDGAAVRDFASGEDMLS